jgi:hypothetical protein
MNTRQKTRTAFGFHHVMGLIGKTVLFTVRVSCRPDVICLRRRIDELTLVTEALRSEQQLLERLKLADARTEGTLGVLA